MDRSVTPATAPRTPTPKRKSWSGATSAPSPPAGAPSAEEQRQVWLREARDQKTRRRLGQRFRMGGFNYFVKVNVALANRGLPQIDLPPLESLEAQLALPLLTQKLLRPLGEVLIGCAPGPCESPGRAPPPGG